jgi:hypothetical protein
MTHYHPHLFLLLAILSSFTSSFQPHPTLLRPASPAPLLLLRSAPENLPWTWSAVARRDVVGGSLRGVSASALVAVILGGGGVGGGSSLAVAAAAAAAEGQQTDGKALPTDLAALLRLVAEAQAQLEEVPSLLKEQKWDGVRALLLVPPLSDLWEKRSGRPLLKNLATAIGDVDGDEMAALEAREDAISHLRFLDMAVYNNVFNPIGSEGATGATKELVRSYYEDPKNELALVQKALRDVQEIAKDAQQPPPPPPAAAAAAE